MLYTTFDSPVGELLLSGDGQALHGLYMQEGRTAAAVQPTGSRTTTRSPTCARSSTSTSTAGARTSTCRSRWPAASSSAASGARCRTFLTARPSATASRRAALGPPATPRNVGATNGRNPISIIVPCHRVVGSDGSLTGYGGGLERKRMLLDLEAGALTLG